jgi:hypothetical protein
VPKDITSDVRVQSLCAMQIADKYTVICYDSTVETLTLRCTWVYFTSARPITECGQYCPLFAERRPGCRKAFIAFGWQRDSCTQSAAKRPRTVAYPQPNSQVQGQTRADKPPGMSKQTRSKCRALENFRKFSRKVSQHFTPARRAH